MLQDSEETIAAAVAATLDALSLGDEDLAARKLAVKYAGVIDAAQNAKERAWVMRWIAPLLLDCLESLGATPAGRSRLKGGKQADASASKLQALRDARRAAP